MHGKSYWFRFWLRHGAVSVALALTLLGVLAARAGAHDGPQSVQIQDRCDPATFNAAIRPGTCAPVGGDVTFQAFLAELQQEGHVGAWRFAPDHFGLKPGGQLQATNTGGETHTFTCVTQFGGGVVPILNQLSGNTTPAVPCAGQDPRFLGPGDSSLVITLANPGTYQYQCLIHPWMRTTVTVDR